MMTIEIVAVQHLMGVGKFALAKNTWISNPIELTMMQNRCSFDANGYTLIGFHGTKIANEFAEIKCIL